MPGILQPTLVTLATLILSLPAHAQAPSNSTLGPGTDRSVTTGIGTSSTFKNVTPPVVLPRSSAAARFMWHTPVPEDERPAPETSENKENGNAAAAPAPEVPEVKEDPRTMITRDRIESPQHR